MHGLRVIDLRIVYGRTANPHACPSKQTFWAGVIMYLFVPKSEEELQLMLEVYVFALIGGILDGMTRVATFFRVCFFQRTKIGLFKSLFFTQHDPCRILSRSLAYPHRSENATATE